MTRDSLSTRGLAIFLTALMVLSVVAMAPVSAQAAPQLELSASQASPGTVDAGDTFTVTYTVENTGDAQEESLLVDTSDSLPSGVSVQSIDAPNATTTQGATAFFVDLAQGESFEVTATYQVDSSASDGDYSVGARTEGNSGATDTASADFTVGTTDTEPSVTFTDQDSLNGDSVLVDSANAGADGEVLAIWNVTDSGAPDEVIASIDISGEVTNEVISLDEPISEQQTLIAAVHSGSPSTTNILASDTAVVSPVEADAVASDESAVRTFWQGQVVVLQGDFTAGNDYQIREVDGARDNREVGSLEREVRAVNDGQLIIRTNRVAQDVYVVEDDGSQLAPGDSLPTNLGTYDGFAFEVAEQDLNAEIEEEEITGGEDASLTLNSNRAGYDAVVSYGTGDDEVVVAEYDDLGDFEEDLVLPTPVLDEEQDIEFNVTVTDTNAEASDTVTVEPPTDVEYPAVGADFSTNTIGDGEQQVGDIVEVTVDFNGDYSNYDDDQKFQTFVTLGGTDSNFVDLVNVRDEDRDGQATFTVNTYLLGTTDVTALGGGVYSQDDTSAVYNVAGDSVADVPSEDDVAPEPDDPADSLSAQRVDEEYIGSDAFDLRTQLNEPVDADTYTVRTHNISELEAGERPITTSQQQEGDAVVTRLSYPVVSDTSSLTLNDRQVGELQTWIAPSDSSIDTLSDVSDGVENDYLTQSSEVAEEDTLVVELNAEGLGGQVAAADDPSDAFTGNDGVFLVVAEENAASNQDRFYLDVDGPGVEFINNQENDTYYVVIDTQRAQSARDGSSMPRGAYSVDFVKVGGNNDGGTFADYFEEGDFPSDIEESAIFPNFGEGVVSPFDPYQDQNEQQLRSVDATVVPRQASFDRVDPDGNLRVVGYENGSTVSGQTTLAPGSEFIVQLQNESSGDRSFLIRTQTDVSADQTWSIQAELGDVPIENDTMFRATAQESGQVIVSDSQAGLEGYVPGILTGASTVTIEDQETAGNGVTVSSVYLPQGGFVTIHDASLQDGATFDSVVGSSQYLPPGMHENVRINVDIPQDQAEQTLIAMPHQDTDEDQVYDFVTSDGANDAPYTTLDESAIVTDSATVTNVNAATPTATPTDEPTATPTDEPTATPTDEPTDTPTDEPTATPTPTPGQPGFGFAVAIIALAGAALLALRRE